MKNTTAAQEIGLSPSHGRYLKLEITSNHNGDNVSSLAELSIFGCPANITGITNTLDQDEFLIYPLPATNFVHIKGGQINKVDILNISGSSLRSINGNKTTEQRVELSGLPSGIYYIKIEFLNGTGVKKFIKQ